MKFMLLAQPLNKNKLEQEKFILIHRFRDFRLYLSDSIALSLRQERKNIMVERYGGVKLLTSVEAGKEKEASMGLGTSYFPPGYACLQ